MINKYSKCSCGNGIKLAIYILENKVENELNCPYCNVEYKIKGLPIGVSCKLIK